jgi:hypothetical protein
VRDLFGRRLFPDQFLKSAMRYGLAQSAQDEFDIGDAARAEIQLSGVNALGVLACRRQKALDLGAQFAGAFVVCHEK